MLEAGDTPYFLSGDLNVDPAESNIIKAMVQKGVIVDVPAAFHLQHQTSLQFGNFAASKVLSQHIRCLRRRSRIQIVLSLSEPGLRD